MRVPEEGRRTHSNICPVDAHALAGVNEASPQVVPLPPGDCRFRRCVRPGNDRLEQVVQAAARGPADWPRTAPKHAGTADRGTGSMQFLPA